MLSSTAAEDRLWLLVKGQPLHRCQIAGGSGERGGIRIPAGFPHARASSRFLSRSAELTDKWKNRVHSLGRFGNAEVYLLDAYDIFIGKLFSKRLKDFHDLRALQPSLEKDVLPDRIRYHAAPLADDPRMREVADSNWSKLFGGPLPPLG